MGCYLTTPNGDHHLESGMSNGLAYGVCNIQGWRRNQEDAHIAEPNFDPTRSVSLFAVFDGHGGAEVALYCERNFGTALRNTSAYSKGNYAVALRDAFLAVDEMLRTPEGFKEVCRLKSEHDAAQSAINDEHAARTDKNGGEAGGLDNAADEEDDLIEVAPGILVPRKKIEEMVHAQMAAGNKKESSASHSESSESSTQEMSTSSSSLSFASASKTSEENKQETHIESSASGAEETQDKEGCSRLAESNPEEVVGGHGLYVDKDGMLMVLEEDALDDSERANVDEEDDDRPSYASGCTAVVALLDQATSTVYVANAGDSRCLLARENTAVDLSVDHKPEDQVEITRIGKAGGFVTDEGRVNGCLNLSRAIGDLRYKTAEQLLPDEQIISGHPDVMRCKIDPSKGDRYLVLMCDGITGSLTNQEVVDRVVASMKKDEVTCNSEASDAGGSSSTKEGGQSQAIDIPTKLVKICSDICDECMSHDIDDNDGAGCDNETFMLIKLDADGSKKPEQASGLGSVPETSEDSQPTIVKLPKLLRSQANSKRAADSEASQRAQSPKRRKVG